MGTDNITARPVVLDSTMINGQDLEKFSDPNHSYGLGWKTLISASKTPTNTFTSGIATCAAGDSYFCLHQHQQAELYYVIEGSGIVEIEGRENAVQKGSIVFIPGDSKHAVRNTSQTEDFVWLYVFAADDFGDVKYRFQQ